MSRSWDCEAYGDTSKTGLGDLCFVQEATGGCGSVAECHGHMVEQRQRVFDRINELASEGHPDFVFLADESKQPEQLLNAAAAESSEDEGVLQIFDVSLTADEEDKTP